VRRNSRSIASNFVENIGSFGKIDIIGLDQDFIKELTMKKYLPPVALIVIALAGFIIYYVLGENNSIWKFWGVIDVSFSVALGILAFMGYIKYLRSEDIIKIRFKLPDGKTEDTDLSTLRKDFNRQELLGLLGMIQKDTTNRFDIKFTKTPAFLQRMQEVQKGKSKIFDIEISKEELEQFESKK